jgi:hypothetical protein
LVAIRYSQARTDARSSNCLEAAPGGEQRLLKQVLGVLRRPDDPVDVQLELTPVRVGQLAEAASSPARACSSVCSVTPILSLRSLHTHHV